MINDYLIPELTSRKCLDQIIFQQDGAPPHTSILVHQLFRENFNNIVISNGLEIKWPPRSPDFSPSDYLLWGYLKSHVYRSNLPGLSGLKNAIRREMLQITREQLHSSVSSFVHRMITSIGADGGYIES